MKRALFVAALSAVCSGSTLAVPIVAHSAQSITELANSSGSYTTYGGLMKDGDTLYYGNYNTVRSYNLSSGTDSIYCSLANNAGTAAFAKAGSSMYMSVDTSYNAPYPSNLGTFSGSGYSAVLSSGSGVGETTYSIYDAVSFGGSYYFSANVGVVTNASGAGYTSGTSVFRLDGGAAIEIATVGGASGGLTFDDAGNLYYASQNSGEGVLKFAATDVSLGGLTVSDATSVLDITASGLDFLSSGELVATSGYGQSLASYDVVSGEKTHDIASTSGWDYMGKFVVGEDDSIYLTSTDWGAYDSTLSVIAVPEPSSVVLLTAGFGGMVWFRRKQRR